ncbi:MAG: sigma 54-interacting transcriptional regulator [Lentisphaerae bacterium]|jgi:DNA-binding NtrC family response regulator|nr:sigma 54-interacting transcriptional regulator [Lentisphaerota bacterium]MBT4821924.1 sigma 54-interacting transcriptional regulator [Lentisphaerota bacterium]MBT5607218.1 sigma 54-interacting transcriptional regulator [Lentisphaerota bacterium]MBT7054243.1 sigma 54-interacting transcriptional regulator [Lentisphaerota bacterium]MBT7842656.1 sigma 54-interacting transcriptional regulator [Lentisphaerota bacterium]
MRILVTWVGHTDLRALAACSDDEKTREQVVDAVGRLQPLPEGVGPVHSLLNAESFDRVIVLSNYAEPITRRFLTWLPIEAECRILPLDAPTDYGAIFRAADAELGRLAEELRGTEYELAIHLSPGTPAMAAVWVLLGKTRYPASFYQSYKDDVWLTEIPFDLTVDVVPELLRGADSNLQHLAAVPPAEVPGFERIAGDSQAIRLAVGRARKAAMRDVPVLLLGESGTGKEMFAQAIHGSSHRREKPFVVVNCAALPQALLESELFGHEKNAFTGANRQYRGAFERADGGTLFLDEIGECTLDLQAKLLRVLQPPDGGPPCVRDLRRVGSEEDLCVDVRVIAATNRDLITKIPEGSFREDLFYRLAVITIRLPALRERKSDIAAIAESLLASINADFAQSEPGYQDKTISVNANAFMLSQGWPGNVRQLYNCLLQAAVMSGGHELTGVDLKSAVAEMPSLEQATRNVLERPLGDDFSIEAHLADVQRHFLKRAMREARGVKVEAARLLGLKNYQTLDAQLKRLQVDWESD